MKTLESLQAMRGFAALAVVFYHVYIILQQPEYGGQIVFGNFANHGLLGVNFFFVLSGFIILMAHEKDIGEQSRIPRYLFRRFARVYPVYWIFLTAYIAASAVGLGYPDFSWSPLNLASSYALIELNEPVTLPLKVAWSLFFEVKFYIIFLALFFSARAGVVVFALWMILIIAASIFGLSAPMNLLSPWNIYFPVGMLAYLAYKRARVGFGPIMLMLGVGMIAIYVSRYNLRMGELKGEYEYVLYWLAPAFAALILGVVTLEKHGLLKVPAVLSYLGDASYSIYLVHSAAISVIAIICKKFGVIELVNIYVLFMAIFVTATVAGIAAHALVERPIIRLVKSVDGRSRRRAAV